MRYKPPLCKEVRAFRQARGWPQQELADRSGISRVEARALMVGRLNPSIATGLSLAHTPGCRVEQLFLQRDPSNPQLPSESARSPHWVHSPASAACRCWKAEVRGRIWYCPCEVGVSKPPDNGDWTQGSPTERHAEAA
ncbi:MAG: helix-turn-helix domain-containing protein, partial [Planctomycetaceae bacterium]